MPERAETIVHCSACESPMDVSSMAPFANVVCPACGEHMRVKCEFGPYTLVRRHAVGGMSMVFVAHDPTLDREVALKILSEDFSADERRIKAFEEEARITASFSHPNVVRVLTTGRSFGRFYIAMELVPGGHFEHQIRERGKIPVLEMLPLAIEVAQGLKAAHAAGLIHRDVKPGNILLDAEGHAKLVDFGLALVTQGGKAQATEVWATPYYVPPETIEGHVEDLRSDIYAFGATVYHALAGKPSCGAETMATDILREAKRKVVPLGIADPSLPADVCRIVERAMAYDPKDRFSSYDEMIGLMESALKRLKSGAPEAVESSGSAAKRRAQKKRDERIALSIAGLVLLVLVGGGIWWITRETPAPEPKAPVIVSVDPVVPEPASTAGIDIAKSYREARAAVEARDFAKAAAGFAKLRGNPDVHEPTRSWAGVEAVVANYLDGQSGEARNQARATHAHVLSVPEKQRIGEGLIRTMDRLGRLPAIPAKEHDASGSGAAHVLAWMLAGLKDWEQGMPDEAAGWFAAVASARIPEADGWLEIYQSLANDYLADHRALSSPVFEGFPADVAGCNAAVAELEKILGGLKTRGRARYSVRAWQLDLTKHSKLLAAPQIVPPAASTAPDLATVMAKLAEFSKDFRFPDASAYLVFLSADPEGATRASLLAVSDASAALFADLAEDLRKEAASGEFPMKSGEVVGKITIDPAGVITIVDASQKSVPAKWGDFSPDAVIALHRIFVKNSTSESERLRRHESAISFDWLAGNRERALLAASVLSRENQAFKQRWETTASGLPK
jgi:tRNA A-37 threonylcarbamoyl transferase component Bud32